MEVKAIQPKINKEVDLGYSPSIKNVSTENIEEFSSQVIGKISENKNEGFESSKDEYREEDIKKAVDELNKVFNNDKSYIEYEQHKVFKNTFIVKIIDKETKETIKEIPPKKILDMIASLCEIAGVIVDEKA